MKLRELSIAGKKWLFVPQEMVASLPITVDGVETAVKFGTWAKELYGECLVDHVDTDGIRVVNRYAEVHNFIMVCQTLFGGRSEFMKKLLNCFYAKAYEADLHFCLGFLYAVSEYDMAVKVLNLVREYRDENN